MELPDGLRNYIVDYSCPQQFPRPVLVNRYNRIEAHLPLSPRGESLNSPDWGNNQPITMLIMMNCPVCYEFIHENSSKHVEKGEIARGRRYYQFGI